MGQLLIEGTELVLQLTRKEKFESLHKDLRVPLSSVVGVEVLEDAHAQADRVGLKVGTRIPGVVEVATVSARGIKFFCDVHKDTPRGVKISLTGSEHDEWIVGCVDPEGEVNKIQQACK